MLGPNNRLAGSQAKFAVLCAASDHLTKPHASLDIPPANTAFPLGARPEIFACAAEGCVTYFHKEEAGASRALSN
jgi:hypothetical protein